MKVLMILGSPRGQGNTYHIAKLVEDILLHKINIGCRRMQIGDELLEDEISMIQLSKKDIQNCKGCRLCFNQSELDCPCKDDVLQIVRKMEEADALVIGSPVFVEDVSGLIKNWIDRMAFNTHRPFLCGKPVYLYTTSGAGASSHALSTLKNTFVSWGGQIAVMDNFSMGDIVMPAEQVKELFEVRIQRSINKLVRNTQKEDVTLFSLIGFQIQKKFWSREKNCIHEADYLYWKNSGWLEPNCRYYRQMRISFMKLIFAKVLASMISHIFM